MRHSLFSLAAFGHSRALWLSISLIMATLVLNGCASLSSNFEQPKLSVTSFKLVPANRMLPKFDIGLRIINPNSTPLILRGLVYSIEIEGHEIITGVANNFPEIPAYGEGDINLQASADLLQGLQLLSGLLQKQQGSLSYNFSARLDVSNLLPDIRISDSGLIDLRSMTTTR